MVTYTTIELDHFNLTAEGNEIADSGSHEAKVFNAVDLVNGIAIAELAVNARRRLVWMRHVFTNRDHREETLTNV